MDLDRALLIENLDVVLLALDAFLDGGIILECDPAQLTQSLRTGPPPSSLEEQGLPVSQETIDTAKQTAVSFLRSFLS